MKKIDVAPFGKRLLAAIMDMALFVSLFLIITGLIITPIVVQAFNYEEAIINGYSYQTGSHLFVLRQRADTTGDEIIIIETKDYTTTISDSADYSITPIVSLEKDPDYVIKHLRYYYISFKTGENVELPTDTETKHYDMVEDMFVSPYYNDEIVVNGVTYLPKDYYTETWFNNEILKFGTDDAVFEYDNDNNYVFTSSFKEAHSDASKSAEENEANILKEGNTYLYSLVDDAWRDLYNSPFYKEINDTVYHAQLVETITGFMISILIVYLLFPMIFKNGETLGKITLKICLVNKSGYEVTKVQVLIRQLFLILIMSISSFIVGIDVITMAATLGLAIFIMMIITLANKEKRSLHDLVAGTLAIDRRTSVFFKDAKEEEKYEKEMEENLANLNKVDLSKEHVIQVKDEIIDPKIKEEIESSKKD